MPGQIRVTKADRARLIALHLAYLDREPEQAGREIPRRGQGEAARHGQTAIKVQNEIIFRKFCGDDLFA